MGKRGNNDGSIRQRKDGTWEARITIGYADKGKPKRISKYFKTRKEAAAWLAEVQTQQNTGQFVQPDKMTVEGWMTEWLPAYAKPKLAVTSYDTDEGWIDCHIIPTIGKIELQKVMTTGLAGGLITPHRGSVTSLPKGLRLFDATCVTATAKL